ncbi:uncharacterized protein LOC110986318 [Acanthaster planci]|uniref:Uncharacterized protein LOC110986318 n=1 Tax=Acanthaster planci TaxID=133434 RepID=A0A8B7ZDN3_ACAPL|nr:uncharacterized protein LOC110986318 [Acanthaster planci]
MSALDPTLTAKRREQLYGASRVEEVRSLRRSLTQDHISNLTSDRTKLPPWGSTTKFAYKGTQPDKITALSWDSGLQNKAHFDMRGDAAPIDNSVYLKSLTNNDYAKHPPQKKTVLRQDNQINLPDMNPRFFRDKTFGSSFYNSDYSKTIQRETTLPDLQKARTEMRRRNVKDIRTTHFQFGNDDSNFQTETVFSFKAGRPQSGVKLEPLQPALHRSKTEVIDRDPAATVQRMLEEERESYVFRKGDYNVTVPKPKLSTFQRDYDATPKEPKSAAFVEPTQIAKGRFLQDNEVLKASMKEEMILTPDSMDDVIEAKKIAEDNSAILRNILLQYDTMKSGYVSRELLQRACNSLLHPIPQPSIDELLVSAREGPGKTIDYLDFIKQYSLKSPLQATKVSESTEKDGGSVSSNPKGQRDTLKSAGATGGSGPVLENASTGKEYQTGVHFEFGSDADQPASIYNKDYDSQVLKTGKKPEKYQGPPSSEVMHATNGAEFGKSTKQSDFVNFQEKDKVQLRSILKSRDKQSLKNKGRHDKNSVILTCDKERDAADRHKSLSHESYVKFPASLKVTVAPPLSKYRYLDGDGALPYPANMPGRSETGEAFSGCNLSLPTETEEKLRDFRAENAERVRDSRRVHFKFGTDEVEPSTEARDNFTEGPSTKAERAQVAGTKNQTDPGYPHLMISKNTQDLSRDPMANGIFDSIRLAKKSYYNTAPNPSDPLHINLRRIIMEMDPDHTGHVTKKVLKEACGKFQINVSAKALDRLIQRCDKHNDDKVDYHQFIRSLTLEQLPDFVSSSHDASLMRHDYRPLKQRSFTNAQLLTMKHMDMKPLKPAPTHFFHADGSGENQFQSVTNQDYIKPELMMAASI